MTNQPYDEQGPNDQPIDSIDSGTHDATRTSTDGPGRRQALAALVGGGLLIGGARADADEPLRIDSLKDLDRMAQRPRNLNMAPRLTYLGGPTYLIEIGDFRIISDPGFDPQGTERSEGPGHVLTKVMSPPIRAHQQSRAARSGW